MNILGSLFDACTYDEGAYAKKNTNTYASATPRLSDQGRGPLLDREYRLGMSYDYIYHYTLIRHSSRSGRVFHGISARFHRYERAEARPRRWQLRCNIQVSQGAGNDWTAVGAQKV